MLKIYGLPESFTLRNIWHDRIEKELGIKNLPYKYSVVDTSPVSKNPGICAVDTEKGKNRIILSDAAIKYLSASEVPDNNVGRYFKDYLPVENCYLLVLEKGRILPVRMVVQVSKTEYDGVELPCIDLMLKNLLLDECYSVSEKKNCMWKFIVYGDSIEKAVNGTLEGTLDRHASSIQEYMDDTEKMYQDTFIHKTVVNYICNKFAGYLESEGYTEDAAELIKRAKVHDNSKILDRNEFQMLTNIINDKSCLRDAKAALSSYKQDAIELHWKNNRHHPEFYNNISDMGRIDRYEFVCDCFARSIQYGTDIMEFIETRQESRFHFPELMYDEIIHSFKVLKSL